MVDIGGTEISLSGVGSWFSNAGSSLGKIFLIILIVAIIGGGFFIFYLKKNEKKQFANVINLFKVVNGKKYWIASDTAKEMVMPGTNVKLFYWKKKKIYSAYPTRAIGPNIFAYTINRMGELTNFDLGDEEEDPTLAKIEFDHRDQTYAYLNLQEMIKRNYKDKTKVSWWQQNLPLITIIVCAILLGLLMWFFFSQSTKQMEVWTQISANMKDAMGQVANALQTSKNLGSGVVPIPTG